MPRRKLPQGKRVKAEQQPTLSPLKNRLTDNNETQVEPVINGVDRKSDCGKADSNKYLHKKFKKVATLEEATPTNGKAKGVVCSVPEEEGGEVSPGSPGRYVCPYCKLACAKPSVLEKHIRAHTNERPYPCRPCGFAFKTRSNLYKHCRSRAHSLKMDETDCEGPHFLDGCSSDEEPEEARREVRTIYKPKFHKAALYAEEAGPPGPEFLHRHINKLISENQAIVDEPVVGWPKKRRESPPRSPPKNGGSKLALALLRPPDLQPLNLSRRARPQPYVPALVDRVLRIDFDSLDGDTRNPEGSVIKDILLRARGSSRSSEVEPEDVPYCCPRCRQTFATLESFDVHYYCCRESLKRTRTPVKDSGKKPKLSPGPLLGNTPLVDYTEEWEPYKRRKTDSDHVSLDPKVPAKSVNLFGGEVHVLDGPAGETKTLRIEPSGRREEVSPSYFDSPDSSKDYEDPRVMTVSKVGLHSGGGTLVRSRAELRSPVSPYSSLPTPVPTPVLPFPTALNPLTSITAFNPLTLPPATALTPIKSTPNPYNGGVVTILHGGKTIPFVPGMPGPNSLLATSPLVPIKKQPETPTVIVKGGQGLMEVDTVQKIESPTTLEPVFPLELPVPSMRVDGEDLNIKKPPPRTSDDMVIKTIVPKHDTLVPQVTTVGSSDAVEKKFLRPTSLPLKPGTYMPKRHVSVPNQVSLVSPETPRPRKSYGQLYLNGHAYTYLGLKCSTRMFFCTLNKPQPIYVPLSPEHNKVSMYSNWKVCSDSNPSPLGLEPGAAMSHYDSRNRSSRYTIANGNRQDVITHSTYILKKEHKDSEKSDSSEKTDSGTDGEAPKRIKVCDGGFESNEEYTYVRGRGTVSDIIGRGRYVCEECGIRCKKPSMLKKHIRTHTDLRPYTCKHCSFSFKTKGNLTKHMKSKAHNKKCVELDISPVPTSIDDSIHDEESLSRLDGCSGHGDDSDEETDDEDEDDDDEETEDEEEGKVRLAAKSLLSLAEVTPQAAHRQFVTAGLVSGRPRTYPYTLSTASTHHTSRETPVLGSVPLLLADKDVMMRREPSLSESDSSDTKSADLCDRIQSSSEPLIETAKPMDLSNKSSTGVRTPVINSVSGQASLLATICSTTERLAVTPTVDVAEESQLLHAYLTERAVRDSMMKQQQVQDKPRESPGPPQIKADLPPSHKDVNSNAKESALGILALTSSDAKKNSSSLPPPMSPNRKLKAEFMPPSTGPSPSYVSVMEDGRSMCGICNKVFNKPSQLRLHVNIHYFERPFRCESCAVSFRTKGHLQKHERSLSHLNKVNMNSTFGAATTSNPRPFKCDDCKIAFRIHGHLAKHLRSKMHIMKLECLGKLPFGTYAELERSGMNMNDIDTTDCENSLESLQMLAQKLYEKDPSKLSQWGGGSEGGAVASCGESSSEEETGGSGGKAELATLVAAKTPQGSLCHRFESDFEKCNPLEDGVR